MEGLDADRRPARRRRARPSATATCRFPLCCPSRATFLTGQYSHNHGVFTTELPNGYNGLNHLNTLPVWLRSSGYRTAMVGKYLNGYGIDDGIAEPIHRRPRDPAGLDASGTASPGGLEQRRYKYKLNEQGKIRFYKFGDRNYVTDVLASQGRRLRQAPGALPQALLPLVQPDRAARRGGRLPRGGARPRPRAAPPRAATSSPTAPRTPELRRGRRHATSPPSVAGPRRAHRGADRRHRPPLPQPPREPARGRRGREADRRAR